LATVIFLSLFLYYNLRHAFPFSENSNCHDQQIGDLSLPGSPRLPTHTESWPPADEFLKYDNINFDVYKKEMHNRVVTVAILKSANLTSQERIDLKDFIFNVWAINWYEFQGFPFDSYTLVIGHNLKYGTTGAFGRGFEFEILDYPVRKNLIGHDLFHAWCSCSFNQAENRTWFTEGVTTYYDFRTVNDDRIKAIYFDEYLNWYNSGYDRPIGDMRMYTDGYDHHFVGVKGAIVAYLLDKELAKSGHHMGEVLRLIYLRYGATSLKSITNDRILAAINKISGQDFSNFFNKYIYGSEKLPLENDNFQWVCHDQWHPIKIDRPMPWLPILRND
jgi:hypothetical protein